MKFKYIVVYENYSDKFDIGPWGGGGGVSLTPQAASRSLSVKSRNLLN